MQYILVALFLWTIALAVFVGGHRIPRAGVWAAFAVLLFLSAYVTSPAGVLQVLVLGGLAAAMRRTVKARTRLIVGTAVTLPLFGVLGQQPVEAPSARHQLVAAIFPERQRLKEQYPIQSLANRLETEAATVADPRSAFFQAYATNAVLAPKVDEQLRIAEKEPHPGGRTWQLQELHRGEAQAFADTPGFGLGRVIPQVITSIEPIEFEPLSPLPDGDEESFLHIDGFAIRNPESVAPESGQLAQTVPAFIVNPDVLNSLHNKSASNFIPKGSLGYVPSIQKASGFLAHRFPKPLPPLEAADNRTWQVVRLELVSLLKFKQPRVYVSKELPQMEQLQSVPTRSLDEFEVDSLKQLWRDENVVIAEEPTRIRMLGALRATRQCLDCHSVQRGQLLGAFSYDLRRQRAAH